MDEFLLLKIGTVQCPPHFPKSSFPPFFHSVEMCHLIDRRSSVSQFSMITFESRSRRNSLWIARGMRFVRIFICPAANFDPTFSDFSRLRFVIAAALSSGEQGPRTSKSLSLTKFRPHVCFAGLIPMGRGISGLSGLVHCSATRSLTDASCTRLLGRSDARYGHDSDEIFSVRDMVPSADSLERWKHAWRRKDRADSSDLWKQFAETEAR
jgi:hypothetical protein